METLPVNFSIPGTEGTIGLPALGLTGCPRVLMDRWADHCLGVERSNVVALRAAA
jgi:hypothetical protein